MKRGKKNKTAKVISLIMTAMMLITSNSIVMASQITWQEEKNESIPGELNVESQNSSPVPELLGRVEENLESVGDITQGDIIKEETVQEVNEAEGNKAEAAEPAESLETQPQAVEIETENVFTYTKNDSDQTAVITGYNGDKSITSLTIPGEIEGCAVIEIGYEAFRSYSALETVNFPQSLVEIGDRAFSGCSALEGIVLNEGLQELGSNAFQNCSELTEIRIPSSLTAVGYSGAFGGCNKLEKVTFAYGMEKTPEYVCRGMQNLKTVIFEDGETDKCRINAIGRQTFYGCNYLETVTLPSNLTVIEDEAFGGCSSLNTADFPEGLIKIGSGAFYNCSALTGIVLNEGLQELGGNAFQNCSELTEIRISSSLTAVGYPGSFGGCNKLEKVTFAYGMEKTPEYVCRGMQNLKTVIFEDGETDKCRINTIGRETFRGCSSLGTVEFEFPINLAVIEDDAFSGCSSLKTVDFPKGTTKIGEGAFSGCGELSEVRLNEGMQELGNSAFYSCSEITEVRFPSTLTTVGYSGAFGGCQKLEKVIFSYGMERMPDYTCRSIQALKNVVFEGSGADPSRINIIGEQAFQGCSSLETVEFPSNLTAIENNAFNSCTSLSTADFPTSLVRIGDSAFNRCSALSSISLNEGLQELGSSVFQNCSGLTQVRIPSSLGKAGENGVFPYCEKLEKVTFAYGMETIPDYICRNASGLKEIIYEGNGGSDSKITAIGDSAFRRCAALEVLELPKDLTSIGQYAFDNCVELVEIKFQEGLKSIGNNAFNSCSALSEAMLPDSLEQIGEASFRYCDKLEIIYIGENISEIGQNTFYVSNQTDTMLLTENDYAEKYAWGNDRRNTLIADEIYKAGDRIKAGIFDTGLIAFMGSGNMDNWTESSQPWKMQMKDISSLYVGKNVRNIGNYMLAGSSLTDLILNGEALESIGIYAFDGCSELIYIEIGNGVASVGTGAFAAAGNVPVPTVLHTENTLIRGYDWAGSNRRILEQVEVYKLGEYAAAYILEGNLTIQGRGDIPNYSGSSMPWKDQTVTSVTIMKGIRKIGNYSFYDFKTIQSVKIPEGLISIGECAFYNCTSIKEIVLPKSVSSMGQQAFYNCSALVSINLSNTGISEIPAGAFEECQSLRVMRIPSTVERVGSNGFKNCTQLNSLTLSEGVSSLGSDAFFGCEKLTSVEIPRSLNSVEISGNGGPFAASGIISGSFAARTRTVVSGIFRGCSSLENIVFPEMISEIGNGAFYGCTSLTQLRLPKILYYVGNEAFYGCTSLKEVVWPEELQEIGDYAFYECKCLQELPLLNYLESIGNYGFYGCENLSAVTFGEELREIKDYSFYKTSLETVNLPYKVRRIGSKAFADNSSLTNLTIPAYTQNIAEDILEGGASVITISGSAGSEAEKFAQNKGYLFQAGIAAQQAVLSKNTITLARNKTAQVKLKISPVSVTDQIIWECDDEKIISVTADSSDPSAASITANQIGKTKVRAKIGGITAFCEVEVGNYATEIYLSQTYVRMTEASQTYHLEASVYPSDAENRELIWKTSDKNIVAVEAENDEENSAKAVLTAAGNGIARVTVSTADGSVKNFCFVHVSTEVPVEEVRISEEDLLFTTLGRNRQLSASVLPEGASDKEVQWACANEAVATVDQQGRVTPVAEGKTEITVTTRDGGKSASCAVTVQFVNVPATGVSLGETGITLDKIGASRQLNAQVQPVDADIKDVQWFSADESVALVDRNGMVTAQGGGTTMITARTKDGGFQAGCRVTVESLIKTITLNPSSLRLQAGETALVAAEITPYSTDIEWYSTNTKVASVDKNALVTAKAPGTASIKCRALDGTNIMASCLVVVGEEQELPPEDKKPASVTLNRKTASLSIGKNITLKAAVVPPNASNIQLKWVSSDNTVASVTQQGKVAGKKKGKAVITVQSVSSPDKKASCTITVTNPKVAKIKINSVKPGKKCLTVKWKKATVTGYQLQYSLKKNFSSKKSIFLGSGKAQRKLTKLKSKRKYYVRVRGYAAVKGQKYYGSWSAVKNKKVK